MSSSSASASEVQPEQRLNPPPPPLPPPPSSTTGSVSSSATSNNNGNGNGNPTSLLQQSRNPSNLSINTTASSSTAIVSNTASGEIRHRKHKHKEQQKMHKKKKKHKKNKNHSSHRRRRRWRWILGKPHDLTPQQEQVFMHMQLRKMNRALTGRRTRKQKYEYLILAIYFVLMFGVVSYNSSVNNAEGGRVIILDLADILVIGFYISVVAVITIFFRESKFISLLYWMFIYLPLVAMITSFVLDEQGDIEGYMQSNQFMAILLATAEFVVLMVFLGLYYLYPRIVRSKWFRRKSRAGTFWRVKVISDWTMTYVGSLGKRFTCKYEGDIAVDTTGLPHGVGRWLDDSFDGEVMTGHWQEGLPIAPFVSRHYGTGDTFKAVRVAYILASDDDFSKSKFHATNEKAPRCGITGVECSISGSFYNELPLATHLVGPNWLVSNRDGNNNNNNNNNNYNNHGRHEIINLKAWASNNHITMGQSTIADLLSELIHLGAEEENAPQYVQIKANDPRGIQVTGHVYAPTGEPFNANTDRVTVLVEHENQQQFRPLLTPGRSLNFMPRASRQSFRPEHIIVCDDNDDDEDDDDDSSSEDGAEDSEKPRTKTPGGPQNLELRPILEDHDTTSQNSGSSRNISDTDPEEAFNNDSSALRFDNSNSNSNNNGDLTEFSHMTTEVARMVNASLKIQDWTPVTHKEALIFFPGYKVTLKEALETFGQFICMTKLDAIVYPIVYSWPVGQRFSYHSASHASCNEKNRDNVCAVLKGLQAGGIRHVHFMTHSLGVQSLLAAFADKKRGGFGGTHTRSCVSECFQLDPDFIDEDDASYFANTNGMPGYEDQKLLICKTMTMINPDFPVEAFVDRGFETLRRVCSTITIIGDQKDKALWGSQIGNGIMVFFGYKQPETLQPWLLPDNASFIDRRQQTRRRLVQEVIGRSIEALYFPDDLNKDDIDDALLFNLRAPVIVCTEDHVQDRAWLDVDVIDTTGLDTNLNGIRHNGFNLNPILLKDLEELITSGRRAIQRATLLYRDGNLFSYCHAPSYVSNL